MEQFLESREKNLINLLKLLLTEDRYFSIAELAELLSLSRNTTFRCMNELEQYLPPAVLQYEASKGVRIHTDDISVLSDAHIKILKSSFFYQLLFQASLRVLTSSQKLQSHLFISRSAAYQKLQNINAILDTYHLQMNSSTLQLLGNEAQIRTFYQYMFYQVNVKYDKMDSLDIIYNVAGMVGMDHEVALRMNKEERAVYFEKVREYIPQFIDGLEAIIDKICNCCCLHLSKSQREEYYYGIFISCSRLKFGHPIDAPTIKNLTPFQPLFNELADVYNTLEQTFHCTIDDNEKFFILQLGKVYSTTYTNHEAVQRQIAFYQNNYLRHYKKVSQLYEVIVEGETIPLELKDSIHVSLLDTFSLLWTFKYLPHKLMFRSPYTPIADQAHIASLMKRIRKKTADISEENLQVLQKFINNIYRVIAAQKKPERPLRIRLELQDGFYQEQYLMTHLQNAFGPKVHINISSNSTDTDQLYDLLITDYTYSTNSNRRTLYWASHPDDGNITKLFSRINALLAELNA